MTRNGSWKHEFDVKYRRAISGGDSQMIDNANYILLEAIKNIDSMMSCQKRKGIWNPKTNKCKVEKYKKTLEDICG